MNAVDYYQRGFNEISKNLVGWVLFYLVFGAVAAFTCGLGGVFTPNVLREVRDALATGRSPDINAIFKTDNLNNDIVNYLIFYGAMLVGGMVGGVGSFLAAIALQMQMPLAAEDRYAPMDNAKLSFRHVTAHLVDHVIFAFIGGAIVTVAAMMCFLPLVIALPVMQAALWLWYQDCRAEIDGFAGGEGIKLLEGPR